MTLALLAFDDFVRPFLIHQSHIRGRVVRLGSAVDAILKRHDYPAPVAHMLAKLLALVGMLSTNLGQEGMLTLQIKGEGPVRFMVADVASGGALRGYAELDPAHEIDEHADLAALFGHGRLMLTLDTAENKRYQGIVSLEGDSLEQAIMGYFTRSEQLDMAVKLAVRREENEGSTLWHAGGIMIERMPEEGGVSLKDGTVSALSGEGVGAPLAPATLGRVANDEDLLPLEDPEDMWRRSVFFMTTVTDDELLDDHLSPGTLLYRLFNEDGVWMYDPSPLREQCRCSRERVLSALATLPPDDLAELLEEGDIAVTCQFCTRTESFTSADITAATS